MKNIKCLTVPLLALIYLICVSSVQARTFKISTLIPDGTFWMKEMRAAAKKIKKQTDGRVKFKFYPGGVMGSEKIVLKKMRIKQLQGAFLAHGVLSSIYRDSQVYALPELFNGYDEVDYIRNKFDDKIIAGLKEKGMISFGLSETGFAYILTRLPIKDTDDLAAYKVWTPAGNEQIELSLNAIGVKPIPLNIGDVLTGLQTNLIDTVIVPPAVAITLQWHTQIKYYSNIPLMYVYGAFVLNKDDFEKLTESDQNIVRDIMQDVLKRIEDKNRQTSISAFEALKQQGINDSSPSEKMFPFWNQKGIDARRIIKTKNIMSDDIIDEVIHDLDEYRKNKKSL